MSNENLLPCPWAVPRDDHTLMVLERTCDRDDEYDPLDRAFPLVMCKCGARVPGKDWAGSETAVAAWNRRAVAPSPVVMPGDEKVEEAIKFVERMAEYPAVGDFEKGEVRAATYGRILARYIRSLSSPAPVENKIQEALPKVLHGIVDAFERELFSKTEAELEGYWLFKWRDSESPLWNLYEFWDMLNMYESQCRSWEEHHHGSVCVVERVRSKYLYPKMREFLSRLSRLEREAKGE